MNAAELVKVQKTIANILARPEFRMEEFRDYVARLGWTEEMITTVENTVKATREKPANEHSTPTEVIEAEALPVDVRSTAPDAPAEETAGAEQPPQADSRTTTQCIICGEIFFDKDYSACPKCNANDGSLTHIPTEDLKHFEKPAEQVVEHVEEIPFVEPPKPKYQMWMPYDILKHRHAQFAFGNPQEFNNGRYQNIHYAVEQTPWVEAYEKKHGRLPKGVTLIGCGPEEADWTEILKVGNEVLEIPFFEKDAYPTFPTYVFTGTSVYENFVKPWCEKNPSRIDYFMWVPAMVMLSNYLGTKIQLKSTFAQKATSLSHYVVLIGQRGLTNKSSCVDDAMQYFNYIGCLTHNGGGLKGADGKSIVFTPGSSEGLGIEMQKIGCHNAIIHFDELSKLVQKSGIDGSSLSADLLTLYESKKFSNSVKRAKELFALDPGTYCASLITCCTDTKFKDLWSKMCGEDTGLNDRTMFLLQPEKLPERSMKVEVNFLEGATRTRQLIDRAIQKGVFEVENWNNTKLQALVPYGERLVARAMKWALALAVDLGLDIIDDECIDRGCDIALYEDDVKRYLRAEEEAETFEGRIQLRIIDKLRRFGNNGRLSLRDLEKHCHGDRLGTRVWEGALYGLIKANKVVRLGSGKKGDPFAIQLMVGGKDQ